MPKLFKERGVECRPMGTNENKHKDKQKKQRRRMFLSTRWVPN